MLGILEPGLDTLTLPLLWCQVVRSPASRQELLRSPREKEIRQPVRPHSFFCIEPMSTLQSVTLFALSASGFSRKWGGDRGKGEDREGWVEDLSVRGQENKK